MWSSISEVYPVIPTIAPVGHVLVVEPQVVQEVEYRPIQPPKAPYELTQDVYSRRLWIC